MSAGIVQIALTAPEIGWLYGMASPFSRPHHGSTEEGRAAAAGVVEAIRRDVPWSAYIGRGYGIDAPGVWGLTLSDVQAFWADGLVTAAQILGTGEATGLPFEALETLEAVGQRVIEAIEEAAPALKTASILEWAARFVVKVEGP